MGIIKEKSYYYLEQSYRDNNKVCKKKKYLGKEIPKNISQIKEKFFEELNNYVWFDKLNNIKSNFNKEFSKLPLTAKKKYQENFLIKFTYNTNKIEGSTITFKETTRLLQEGRTPSNKSIKDIKEVESHKLVFEEMISEKGDLTLDLIKKWHEKLFFGIDDEIAGKIRTHNVAIAGLRFEPPSPNELEYLLRQFIQWYKNSTRGSVKLHPVELAALVHLKFVTIHPFTDGNGRISRLLMNFILNRNDFPMLDITYLNRNNYYTALERSQTKNEERIFVMHIIKRYMKDYKKYI
jgi:Fic family protein